MLKMIIADDEYIVRDGLKNVIDWNEFGIDVVGEACNGKQALELCESLHPDILFTDISMPIMDGLEVAMRLKDNGSNIKLIIISGIKDFNYAKTALSFNAEGYILKPVDIIELEDVIKKVVKKIEMEKNQENNVLRLKQQIKENIGIVREKFLSRIVHGVTYTEHDIQNKLTFLEIPLKYEESVLISVLQIDEPNTVAEISEEDKQLLNFGIANITNEIVNNYNCGISFCPTEDKYAIIFNESSIASAIFTEVCEEIVSCLNKLLHVNVSVGIGGITNSIRNVSKSYKDAINAINYRFYTGKNSIINISDINTINNVKFDKTIDIFKFIELEEQLVSNMKLGDKYGVFSLLDKIFSYISIDNKPSFEYIKTLCVEIITVASRNLYEINESMECIIGSHSDIAKIIFDSKDVFELRNYLGTIFQKLSEYFLSKNSMKNDSVINSIKELIHQKYSEGLSVTSISNAVFLTPNYVSLIFKEKTGETITEYITKLRMEKAKKLLKTTELKIHDIAEDVGYENANYFSTVFRKYTGYYPQKYRSDG